ncbi:hypothetical protein FJ492_00425 [Mesorhizobium sp. B2-5-4]|uniref:DUF6615 family protein n=1 Tax=Mesorhizobium sp. B2-5-4 TaxID=2589926 RepID=UPI00112928E9|nr:DUF6615 family protein [Mesorhizobium sp. B2-5-4]TPK49598.1 hypothetical protein FJ492_00425 [Mesorhizobium sp. B2-5-4]
MASKVQLCDSFRKEAGRVWRQMTAARNMGLFLGEETITETCLYNIAAGHWTSNIAIIPATKPQEYVHGADWEWWFTRNGRGVGYRVQAKRLFPSGRYESLFESVKSSGGKYGQLHKLVAKAKADKLDPLYCFYNFDYSPGLRGRPNSCVHSYRGPSFWGCTIALPQDVELAGSDAIKVLRHNMVPWHSLVCAGPKTDLPTSVQMNIGHLASRTFVGPNGVVRRAAIEVASEQRELPDYVNRLIELGRSTRDAPPEERSFIDTIYWLGQPSIDDGGTDLPGHDIAGITVFDQEK